MALIVKPITGKIPDTGNGRSYDVSVLELIRSRGGVIDEKRHQRAIDHEDTGGAPTITRIGPWFRNGNVYTTKFPGPPGESDYETKIDLGTTMVIDCTCEDAKRTQGACLCKHAEALAVVIADEVKKPTGPVAPTPTAVSSGKSSTFQDLVNAAISQAIEAMADQVQELLELGEIPFLIGPTDCGKTSAVRRVAVRNGWTFEPIEGCESMADLDLVGAIIGGQRLPGPLARAFTQARSASMVTPNVNMDDLLKATDPDEIRRLLDQAKAAQLDGKVLIFLDEFTRNNTRAMDILMTPLLPTPAAVAKLMGIPTEEDVRYITAPLWGREWAPAAKTPMVLACNPWGSQLDPALMRRVFPIKVEFAPPVAKLFKTPLSDVIESSWQMVTEGKLALPLGYKTLRGATNESDTRMLKPYLLRLQAIDPASAEGFRQIVVSAGFNL